MGAEVETERNRNDLLREVNENLRLKEELRPQELHNEQQAMREKDDVREKDSNFANKMSKEVEEQTRQL